jgi:hypothetical protein
MEARWPLLCAALLACDVGTPGGSGVIEGPDAGKNCMPATCVSLQKNCGFLPDLCGGSLNCGTCEFGFTCGGGGVANVCGNLTAPGNPPALRATSPDGSSFVSSPDGLRKESAEGALIWQVDLGGIDVDTLSFDPAGNVIASGTTNDGAASAAARISPDGRVLSFGTASNVIAP